MLHAPNKQANTEAHVTLLQSHRRLISRRFLAGICLFVSSEISKLLGLHAGCKAQSQSLATIEIHGVTNDKDYPGTFDGLSGEP